MKYFNALIKPASSHCNMKCKYCFYHDISSKREIYCGDIMTNETSKMIIHKILNYFVEDVEITFAFQGGEPTLAGIEYFKYFIDYVNSYKKEYHHIRYSIQTNSILLDEEWIKLFKNYQFLVGISLDGFKENHDKVRVLKNNKSTYELVMKNIQLLKDNNITYNILTVLTSSLSKHPKEYFVFYKQLFPLWFNELNKGNNISFNYFDNLILLFNKQYPYQCGYLGYCSMQFVIESDGSVYPCDFYCLDSYKIGNMMEHDITQLIKSKILYQFVKEEKRISKLCQTCKFKGICNGNCKRQNICYFDDEFCALKEFMTLYEKQLHYIKNLYRY